MNNSNGIIFQAILILLISFTSLHIYGQRKEIIKEEYFKAYNKAFQKMQKVPYRLEIKRHIYNKKSEIQRNETTISEFVPPNKFRIVTNMTNPTGFFEFERIIVGNNIYEKDKLGSWTKRTFDNKKPKVTRNVKTEKDSRKYFYLGKLEFENQLADVYETERILSYTNNSVNVSSLIRNRRWIGEDGLIIKLEMETEILNPKRLLSRSVSTYEYNPENLTIEAPFE